MIADMGTGLLNRARDLRPCRRLAWIDGRAVVTGLSRTLPDCPGRKRNWLSLAVP